MTEDDISSWVQRYLDAWGTNDAADIGDLFTEDAEYFTAPYRQPWRGRENIVENWLKRKDEQGSWGFRFEVLAVAERLGFVRGWTEYEEEHKRYSNLWVIRLAGDGRAAAFTEWWMEEK